MATLRTTQARISRRALIKGGLALGTGLVVGFRLPVTGRGTALAQTTGVFAPNQWIKIDRDGLVTIVNSVVEMGYDTAAYETNPMPYSGDAAAFQFDAGTAPVTDQTKEVTEHLKTRNQELIAQKRTPSPAGPAK